MQYYIKFFNNDTGEFVGYYKDIGKNCITAMPKGTKYFDTLEAALQVAWENEGGFLRDKDKKYYTAKCVIYCDSHMEPKPVTYGNPQILEEEKLDAINTIIRENNSFGEE